MYMNPCLQKCYLKNVSIKLPQDHILHIYPFMDTRGNIILGFLNQLLIHFLKNVYICKMHQYCK